MIYHLCSQAEWAQSVAAGKHTAGGMPDGFIHFSTREQVLESAARHFAGRPDLMLVAVDLDRLGPALKWEPSRGGALFPHLYEPLDPALVACAVPLPLGQEGPQFRDVPG
ncbi:MAG: DUF952 domain-containing protein [Acetobacteraceae bacterium]|nr:DUF952 domain-containing protein [Acetobacteraceae bacterium]